MPPLYNAYEAKLLNVLHSKLCKEKLVFLSLNIHSSKGLALFFCSLFRLFSSSSFFLSFFFSFFLSWDPIWRSPFPKPKNVCSSVNLKSHLAISFNQSYMTSHLATSLNPKLKNVCVVLLWRVTYPKWKMVSLWRVTYPSGKKKEWSHSYGWPTQGEEWPYYNGWPTQVKKDGEWSHSNGWPTQKNGLIVMGDLPKWKKGRAVSFLWVTYPGEECPHYNGWPTQVKKDGEWSHSNGWPT